MKRPARVAALILAVLATAAGAVAVASWAVRLRGAERRFAEGRSSRVLELDPAHATALRVSVRGSGEPRRLVRDGRDANGRSTWQLESPVTGLADAAVVETLLARLAALERRATVVAPGASPERLRFYGLDRPEAALEVTLDDGRSLSLAFGTGTGDDGAMFVQPGSGEVVLVASEAREVLLPTLARLAGGPVDAGQAPAPASPDLIAPPPPPPPRASRAPGAGGG